MYYEYGFQLIEQRAESELLLFDFYNMQQISGVISTLGIVPSYFGAIVMHLCQMHVDKLSFADIAAIASTTPMHRPKLQNVSLAGSARRTEQLGAHELRAATANIILHKLHKYSIHRGSSYWSSALVKRLRIVTLIEQRNFTSAVKLIQVCCHCVR